MSLEDEFKAETRAMERIASALERWATIAEKRFAKDFPEPRPKRDAELIRSDERADQYSDKPTAEWFGEKPKEAEPSRFEQRFKETGKQEAVPKKRRVVEVPKGDGTKARAN